ncbi:MAG: AAA family ATPase [Spirochaetia bacterium]|nr:AAA family ATPase [Spirochaetia bacterium]
MFRFIGDLYWKIKGVRIFALVGESGTGKSFRAKLVAQKYGIDFIIDDGLLIRGDAIVAGRSAKKEQHYMAAVKTALFHDKKHRDEVARLLAKSSFKKVLVLGTSEKMVRKITERLQIPHPHKIIRIEDIASQAEIEKAIRSRKVEGKHVIPVPAIEIRRSYPHIFYDSVRVFLQRNLGMSAVQAPKVYEKAVVRPEFSKRGRVAITESALAQMVIHCVDEFNPAIRIQKISVRSDSQGYRLTLGVEIPYGTQLSGNIHNLQQYIIDAIERFTGILIEEVNIVVDRFAPQ